MEFFLDPEYLNGVTVVKEYYRAKDPANPTPEEIISILRDGPVWGKSISNEDHPEFAKLRNQLEHDGYIQCQRTWRNGDQVLVRFVFNGAVFDVGDQFPCAAAMQGHLKYSKMGSIVKDNT
jgi:hypothetical protein